MSEVRCIHFDNCYIPCGHKTKHEEFFACHNCGVGGGWCKPIEPQTTTDKYPNSKGGRKASKYRLLGRQDVIDWINSHALSFSGGNYSREFRESDWQKQLKEWGIGNED
jgi:hypothetical protein